MFARQDKRLEVQRELRARLHFYAPRNFRPKHVASEERQMRVLEAVAADYGARVNAEPFSDAEKLREIERELGQRDRIYKPRGERPKKYPMEERQMAILEAIAADYRQRLPAVRTGDQVELFGGG